MEDLRMEEEPRCGICLTPYTDPVPLQCGHIFCRICITYELDAQKGRGVYSCPDCGDNFHECPPMLQQTVCCTYCLDDSVPATKTCLHCAASLCVNHLSRHSKEPEHVLVDPTVSAEDRKCPVHRQVKTHYCMDHDVFICSLCYTNGDHLNHEVLLLRFDYSENEKKYLRICIKTLRRERQKIETQIHSLQVHEAQQEAKSDAVMENVIEQIQNIHAELNDLQDNVLSEVQAQRGNISTSIVDSKIELENQMQELSGKINNIEELQNIRDPLTFVKEVLRTDLIGIFNVEHSNVTCNTFDETPILETLHKEVLKFADGLINRMLKDNFPKMKKSQISLDLKTAHCNIVIRSNLRVALYSSRRQSRRANPARFRSRHVLSECNFSSGNHYWEVEVNGVQCSIGVAYDNIERKSTRKDSRIGYNRRSWALSVDDNISVRHNYVKTRILTDSPVRSFGIFLEYEAGRLSFYQLCDPIRHLHTYSTIFTRPLHVAFYLGERSKIMIK